MISPIDSTHRTTKDSYLTECLQELRITPRTLKNIHLNNLDELEKIIQTLFRESGTKLGFYQTNQLGNWLDGLLNFHEPSNEIAARTSLASLTPQEGKEIKALFQDIFQTLFHRISYRADILKAIFQAIDQWQRRYNESTQSGFCLGLDVRITIPEANPYAKENESHYLTLTQLLFALEQGQTVIKNRRYLTASQQFGAYLFFAITQSGVTQAKQLQQLIKISLDRSEMDPPFSGFLFLKDPKKSRKSAYSSKILKNQSQQIYRWIPDPITKSIYERCRNNWESLALNKKNAKEYIHDFLSSLKLKNESILMRSTHLKIDLSKLANQLSHVPYLVKASLAYQRRTLPSFIWHYLENQFETKDLQAPSIERLHECHFEVIEITNYPDKALNHLFIRGFDNLDIVSDEPADPDDSNINHPIDWCNQLFKIVNSQLISEEKIKILKDLKNNFPKDDFQLIYLLTDWLEKMLLASISTEKIFSYLWVFYPAMIQHFDLSEELVDFDHSERAEELEELITETLTLVNEQSSEDDKEAVLREAWHEFHVYLLSISYITSENYLVNQPKRSQVDAEYISEVEYRGIQAYLCDQQIATRLRNQCLLILTLAYRFGLRRSEVIKLATRHVSYKDDRPDQLCIRWWENRRLKSPSSKRNIPIEGVLTEQEYLWLHLMTLKRRHNQWLDVDLFKLSVFELQQAIKNLSRSELSDLNNELPGETFLFIDDEKLADTRVLEIVKIIHEAMRTVVGNTQLRFHHLRHSCAMNTLMYLLSPKLSHSLVLLTDLIYGNKTRVGEFTKKLGFRGQSFFNQFIFNEVVFEKRSLLLRQSLLNQKETSTSEVYTTARLLGHSSPRTTFASYVHILPILTGAFLHERYQNYSMKLKKSLSLNNSRSISRQQLRIQKGDVKTLIHRQKLGRPTK